MSVEFTLADEHTLSVFDPIMRHRARVEFATPIDPVPTDPESFFFPIERAVTVRTTGLKHDSALMAVWDENGHRVDADPAEGETLPPGQYYFNLRGAVKVYARLDEPTEVELRVPPDGAHSYAEFDREVPVTVGARSTHERPEATITSTADPADVMTAVSWFSSALKDTGPMRSFGTLRGHPPAIERGDALDIPDGLDRPDTGIRLELPSERRFAYAAATPAYYLGARVEPGDDPLLVTEAGTEHALDRGFGVEHTLARLLRRTFFLDALVREDDPYCEDYKGREAFETETGVSLDGLYDRSPAARLDAYLDIPDEAVDRFSPNWRLGARVSAAPASMELLPSLANGLATIHPLRATKVADSIDELPAPGTRLPEIPLAHAERVEDETVVRPEPVDAARQLWVGPGTPMGVEEPGVAAVQRDHDRAPIEGNITYTVVCNDDQMAAENETVQELIEDNAGLAFDVDAKRNLAVDELRDVLATDTEVVHFIGHTDTHGLVCPDGHLDAATLEAVGADVVFLNSCLSYAQGWGLVDAGAQAAVVTLGEIENSLATTVGRHVATLINQGIDVGGAVDIATDVVGDPDRYTVVGNPTVKVVSANIPALSTVVERSDDQVVHSFHLSSMQAYGAYIPRMEAGVTPTADEGVPLFDAPDVSHWCVHEPDAFLDHVTEMSIPLWVDGGLKRSEDLSVEDFRP